MRGYMMCGAAGLCLIATAAGAQPARPSLQDMQVRTAAIARQYLADWSGSPDGAAGAVPYVYGPAVRFYGRTLSQAQLAAAKRGAVRQWPIRSYTHRPGTMRVICSEAELRCGAQSIIDYRVSNPSTGRSAQGSTNLDLGVSFEGPQPVILYESGRVHGRDPSA